MADLGLEFDPSEEKPFDEYVKGGGPLNLLEAVYCDPCKAKVSFLGTLSEKKNGITWEEFPNSQASNQGLS